MSWNYQTSMSAYLATFVKLGSSRNECLDRLNLVVDNINCVGDYDMIKYRYNTIIKLNLEKSGTWQSPFEQSGTWKYPRNDTCWIFCFQHAWLSIILLFEFNLAKFRWILDYFCVFVCLTDNVCSLKDHTILQCSVVQYSSQVHIYVHTMYTIHHIIHVVWNWIWGWAIFTQELSSSRSSTSSRETP